MNTPLIIFILLVITGFLGILWAQVVWWKFNQQVLQRQMINKQRLGYTVLKMLLGTILFTVSTSVILMLGIPPQGEFVNSSRIMDRFYPGIVLTLACTIPMCCLLIYTIGIRVLILARRFGFEK